MLIQNTNTVGQSPYTNIQIHLGKSPYTKYTKYVFIVVPR